MVAAPSGTTHFRIISAGTEVDFTNETFVVADSATAILPWDSTITAPISLMNQVTAASVHPLFLALGIEFFQQVNNTMYSLKNGAFNPLSLAAVSGL